MQLIPTITDPRIIREAALDTRAPGRAQEPHALFLNLLTYLLTYLLTLTYLESYTLVSFSNP